MKIIIITGQTATGKTNLALQLAQKNNGELINCDSRQIYKKLDIITGKELDKSKFNEVYRLNNFSIGYFQIKRSTLNVQYSTKIWLYDIVDPKKYFSSFDYQQSALSIIKKLQKENKTPIIVGGTYFYLKHLLYGVETENIPPDFKLRKELETKSVLELQIFLKKLSLQSFNQLNQSDKNNSRRLIRKIEIFNYLKEKQAIESPRLKTLSNANWKKPRRFNYLLAKKLNIMNLTVEFIGLKFKNKNNLIQAINNRVKKRIKTGAFEEVKNLLKNSYDESNPGLKTIGYQQIIKYLKGKLNKQEAINQWITREIQYAKRQYTFMKKDKNICWKII